MNYDLRYTIHGQIACTQHYMKAIYTQKSGMVLGPGNSGTIFCATSNLLGVKERFWCFKPYKSYNIIKPFFWQYLIQ